MSAFFHLGLYATQLRTNRTWKTNCEWINKDDRYETEFGHKEVFEKIRKGGIFVNNQIFLRLNICDSLASGMKILFLRVTLQAQMIDYLFIFICSATLCNATGSYVLSFLYTFPFCQCHLDKSLPSCCWCNSTAFSVTTPSAPWCTELTRELPEEPL